MKKIPKARINDTVERIDMVKLFGRVIAVYKKTVKVDWHGEKRIENIKDLALVKRSK